MLSSMMLISDLGFGGVISIISSLLGDNLARVGEVMPLSFLEFHPNEGFTEALLLSPRGLITCLFEFDVITRGRCDCFEGSSW